MRSWKPGGGAAVTLIGQEEWLVGGFRVRQGGPAGVGKAVGGWRGLEAEKG